MKKITVILLLLIYGLSSFGMTLHVHYCCGKIDKVSINAVKNDKCPVGKMAMKRDCCDDRQVELKIKADYKNEISAVLVFNSFDAELSAADFSNTALIDSYTSLIRIAVISPPFTACIPLYIKHCIYRI